MNPGYPTEAVALQGTRNDGQAAQHQYVINMPAEPPMDHVVWSICSLMHGNCCCLGLAALIFSVKARDRKVIGDVNGARHYGSTARSLNIAATILTILSAIILIVVVAGHISVLYHTITSSNGGRYRYK
ncbi:dispanin subfamily A member 2b-like [Cololabis saira]|uniref:dispanin subfamily A member 2b-like n=1 Tax=Cololabis saira TaxID=129043 RepID=UPI002AD4B9B5|nr:dispanin subfamily A member 2b-like [Cololabis saira]